MVMQGSRLSDNCRERPGKLRRGTAARIATAVLVACFLPSAARGQFDLAVERELLHSLYVQGRYRQALEEARRAEQLVQPKKSAKIGPQTGTLIELLIYEGSVERRMGNLDEAEELLGQAAKQFFSKDVQRAIYAQAPRGEEAKQVREYWRPLNETYFRLLDNQTELVLERLRSANHALAIKADPPPDPAVVNQLFKRLDELIRLSLAARSSALGGVGEEESDPSAKSPYQRMMFTQARPQRYAGMRYAEASRLPWAVPSDRLEAPDEDTRERSEQTGPTAATADPDRAAVAESQRRRALGYLRTADRLAAAAAEQSLARFKTDELETTAYAAARKEAALVRADGLVALGEALMLERRFDDARASLDRGIALISEGISDRHPLLALPSILSAQNSLAQAQAEFQAGNAASSQEHARQATEALKLAKELIEAPDSQYDPASPLHTLLADLLKSSQSHETKSADLMAARDAADAAARRALQALSRGSARRVAPAPRPADNSGQGSP
jgi:tetratricopeptide (TPR) repeat protein